MAILNKEIQKYFLDNENAAKTHIQNLKVFQNEIKPLDLSTIPGRQKHNAILEKALLEIESASACIIELLAIVADYEWQARASRIKDFEKAAADYSYRARGVYISYTGAKNGFWQYEKQRGLLPQ